MKKLFILLTIFLFSQMTEAQKNNNSYEELWQQVQKLENDDLTKSALKIVTSISEKAKKEKNNPQIIKCLLHRSKYALIIEEDAQLKIITDFKAEIKKAKSPVKNVLESYLAGLYWQYFQHNRYQSYNRTKTATKVDPIDFRTWDITTLFNEITFHYNASLENEAILKKTLVSDFDVILDQREDTDEYRPTLYDLLAHNALAFYTTSENNITRPADKFEIDNPELLCDGNAFIKMYLTTEDKTSLQIKALKVYQKLLLLHQSSSQPYTYAEVNLERLNFIYNYATFENKEAQYAEVLQNSASAQKGTLASGLYNYKLAAILTQQGDRYNNSQEDELNRWKKKEALSICEGVTKEFPESRGADQCKTLQYQILQKSLQLTSENNIPTNKISRILVNYKNLDGLNLSAHLVTKSQLRTFDKLYNQNEKLDFIKKLKITKEWQATLKNEKDYLAHSTEISIPALENGYYLILAENQDTSNKTFSFSSIQVTDISITSTRRNEKHYFQIIDRNNGKPITNANVIMHYEISYNGTRLSKKFTSDNMGNFIIPSESENLNNVDFEIRKDKNKAYFQNYYIYRKYTRSNERSDYTCFLFTDRSIYRPGQPLYFKGIAVKKESKTSTILKNQEVEVSFRDANGQVIKTKKYTTNDYGSFAGDIILPSNGLTGQFSMEANSSKNSLRGYTNFSVEEYKRPKFETSFESVKESYKINDSVTVTGKATAYAGSSISDAKVTYRVTRNVNYPRWCYWYYPNLRSESQEIAFGETTSNASGKYDIRFKALPDNTVDKSNLPTFTYNIVADVTDINGETHSTSTRVSVGYRSMNANMYMADPFNKDATDNKLHISTNNLNGYPVSAKGVVKMYKLKGPSSVNRPRLWAAPDYEGWSEETFKKMYPHDVFSNKKNNVIHWEKGDLVWQTNFDTEKTKEISIENTGKWLSGKYVLELETKDKFGLEVKDILQVTLYSPKDKKLADNELFKIKTDKSTYAPGEYVKVTLLSSSEDINITVNVEKNQKVVDTKLIQLNNNSKSFTIPVTKDDIGGFGFTYSFSVYNYFNSGSVQINVPYPSTQLQIETLTFRDKLEPGTDETWSFKIKGPKGDKVSAELLANMYDASLNTFRGHYWSFYPLSRPTYYVSAVPNAHNSFGVNSFNTYLDNKWHSYSALSFDSFNWFRLNMGNARRFEKSRVRRTSMLSKSARSDSGLMELVEEESEADLAFESVSAPPPPSAAPVENKSKKEAIKTDSIVTDEKPSDEIKIRKNLKENAFFFPQLHTDAEGNVTFSFTTPEALTKWKVQLLAHTKNLESTIQSMQTVTQKKLMVTPNAPRFLREGDKISISTKISNLSEKELSGQANLILKDALTGKEISKNLILDFSEKVGGEKAFKVDSLGNTQVTWKLSIPDNVQAVQYTVTAQAGDFSDGEQNLLPVLSNRMLVTETLPMWVRSNQTKKFTLDKLKTVNSTTLKHHKLSLEMTSNPAWYAIQALPYLMEYPHECNEQIFSRYYANSLATHIANSNPRIQEVFKQWANSDALISNLEKNQELKSLLIEETPWLRDAQSETEQKKRIALLFNLDKMKQEQTKALNKLKNSQNNSGGWSWFYGGPDNRFITQHILTGIGHLKQLSVKSTEVEMQAEIKKAISYLDQKFVNEYENMKQHATNIKADHLSNTQIHYLYMRSFFKDIKSSKKADKITAYYMGQAQKYWKNKNLYSRGMLALITHRAKDEKTTNKILRALKENSITSDELGMYWKENTNSWYWYQAPIETQSLLIEAFSEINPEDITTIDNLKIWLLKNKQTNQWKTTKATTEAAYALLLQGSDWLSVSDAVEVLIGGKKITPSKLENVKVEAGTGYYKTTWNGNEVKPTMGEVEISKKGNGIAWGALYWQYFEDLDKITPAETPLKLKKKLFLKKNTATGEEISEISSKTKVKVGDLVRVRIELRADRPMEFVHMKDMRAAGFEPINVISRYKWQDGLGYYESTKDASTNFFFDYLPKGIFVFEYDVRVNNAGDFSNGITTIQSMYAPEFSSHSEGVRVNID